MLTQDHQAVYPKAGSPKILRFPLTRIVIAVLFLVPVLVVGNLFAIHVIDGTEGTLRTLFINLRHLLVFLGLLGSYALYVHSIERRQAVEISVKGNGREVLIGGLISLGIVAAMVMLMAGLGYYRIQNLNPPTILLAGLIHYGFFAFLEELVFRVIMFRLLEELTGSWIAMVVSGTLFGLAHLPNPNATVFTSLSITAADTVLYSAAFMLTRRVWMVWGLHLGWNLSQSGLFGMPNSGTLVQGLITPVIEGPTWITGGPFGIEGSVIQVFVSLLVGLAILRLAYRAGAVVAPPWKRRS